MPRTTLKKKSGNRNDTKTEIRNEDYRAVLLRNGKVELRCLVEGKCRDQGIIVFPEKDGPAHEISCVELTPEFFIFGTKSGSILYYHLNYLGPNFVGEHKHGTGEIRRLWPNKLGTRLLFEDGNHALYLHNPLNDQIINIPDFSGTLETVLWDTYDNQVLILSEAVHDHVYLYSSRRICCPSILFLGSSSRPTGSYPLVLHNGVVTCQMENGALEDFTLDTHLWLKKSLAEESELNCRFNQNISLLRFKEAWGDALLIKTEKVWTCLVQNALRQMELEIAIKACLQTKNVKLLMSLRQLEEVEDFDLLSGYILVLLEDYDAAQECFLKSSNPGAALDMRRGLQQWDQALALAVQLNSSSTSDIKWGYAQLLERRGEYRHSLLHYQEFLSTCAAESNKYFQAKAGIARTSIQLGDIWKGKQIAMECSNSYLYNECAKLLEALSLPQDAAELYEKAGQPEKAARIFILFKNYAKAWALLKELQDDKLYAEYAKAMEADKQFDNASAAYEAADDIENVLRLQLGPLKNPFKAFTILHKARSIEGALMAVKYCKTSGDYGKAIEFLIMAGRTHEALELAQQHQMMDIYTELVVGVATKDELLELARYYESTCKYAKAATLFEHCGEANQALQLCIHWGTSEAIEQAINMVGKLRSETLTAELFNYLMDDTRREECQKYLFHFHLVLGNYEEATKSAMVISYQEQEAGNYKSAHQLLFQCWKALKQQDLRVPLELSTQLMLLHSYILVKILIRLDDHRASARMLIRISRHISKFPSHVVQILTSTVIECQRSGLKKAAFEFASMLMHPEYRSSIAAAYKRKIEKIVRKPERTEDEEPLSPCPFCSLPIPETQLDCPACRSNIPFCIVSGRHMVLDDWTACPKCQFPALMSQFVKALDAENTCPMCLEVVSIEELKMMDHLKDE